MKNRRWMLSAVGLAIMFAVGATAANAPTLKFRFTKADVPGAQQTFAEGINNAGVTVGYYVDSGGLGDGYILKGKQVTNLDDPNAVAGGTIAISLNPDGTISVVGTYVSGKTGYMVGFLYKGGSYTDIPGPAGAVQAEAFGINDSGAIVGFYQDSGSVQHGFLLKGKEYTTLDVPGATATWANGINKSGRVALQWLNQSGAWESSLYNGKTYTTIDVPGAVDSYAADLNAAGDVCYGWTDSSGASHGALLHSGKYYKFDYPKSTATYGQGINDKGNIIGDYQTASGGQNYYGFKATY